MARLNESCAQCHREQTRPFIFEHAALREGCTTCHNPHGSVNAKLLTIRDQNLCLRCHAQTRLPGAGVGLFIGNVDHTSYVAYGTCWTAGCHASIHGSNTNLTIFIETRALHVHTTDWRPAVSGDDFHRAGAVAAGSPTGRIETAARHKPG